MAKHKTLAHKKITYRTDLPRRSLWTFPGRLDRVVDGDTIDMCIDSGFSTSTLVRLSLLGVNAPKEEGPLANPELADTVKQGVIKWFESSEEIWRIADFSTYGRPADNMHKPLWPFVVELIEPKKSDPEKFNQWLGILWRGGCPEIEQCLNIYLREWLKESGIEGQY